MSRYFFHLEAAEMVLDGEGLEFPNPKAARDEAIQACGEMLRDIPDAINDGKPFRLWVTDSPHGRGNLVFTLTVTAETE
jgi:hypothetical protein